MHGKLREGKVNVFSSKHKSKTLVEMYSTKKISFRLISIQFIFKKVCLEKEHLTKLEILGEYIICGDPLKIFESRTYGNIKETNHIK